MTLTGTPAPYEKLASYQRCIFAYVGNPAQPSTWKLPYRLSDGKIDVKRLPPAIG